MKLGGKKILRFESYNTEGFYDEFFDSNNTARSSTKLLLDKIQSLPDGDLIMRQSGAEKALLNMGITFNVYGDNAGTEKIFPFDIIPRIIDEIEWKRIEKGLIQRVYALNQFIDDIYNEQKILKDKIIPEEVIKTAKSYRELCKELKPQKNIWCHITGSDLIRDKDGQFYVLEDNLRCPSGVSYVLENRQIMKQTFPQIFESLKVKPVSDYSSRLLEMLEYLVADKIETPTVAVLTPGVYNSAYFEHSFLALQMGIELVEGRDLIVSNGFVYMRTTKGFQKVDVLYRRIDDDFLDPLAFRADSLLGIPGIMEAYKKGNICLANAPGTGIADDKVIYSFVPEIVKYYLGEDIIIPNVPTYNCYDEKQRKYILENMNNLVIKTSDESGGYGMLIGPEANNTEIELFKEKIKANPRKYLAQPVMSLSRVPVLIDDHFEGRHVDLRPYIIYGEDIYVIPGGLTRVALRKGSLVVNSSQGGGSKDTWVVSIDNKIVN
ncbi:MAG: circularly permuted type 2 ATP-grasp protein [Cyanobacteriota bacterium]